MSWQEVNKMSLRREFITLYLKGAMSMTELCKRYQIARTTGYELIKRYSTFGMEAAIQDRSRRPNHSPNKTPDKIIKHILEVRKQHPYWGGRKIKAVLKRQGIKGLPAASTISGILTAHGCIKTATQPQLHFKRFEHEAPNHLWQVDFKGHFQYEQGRCHPLTVLDDHSRFSLALAACTNEQEQTVRSRFIQLFKRYGLPLRMNFDNGAPWGSIFYACRYTTLSVWLIDHGIQVSYSRPRHPQTNGKIERFHRTLKQEIITPNYFIDIPHIQKVFTDWQSVYNHKRPHEALDMQVPADRYQPSYRNYQEPIQAYEYADDYLKKQVDCRGRLALDGRKFFVGCPFSKRWLGIRMTEQGDQIEVYYRHQRLALADLNKIKKGCTINVYSGAVLQV